MTITQMLSQSALLTLLGMGVVFVFLIIMIICMNLLHRVIHAFKLDKEEPAATAKKVSTPSQADNGSIIAAIAAAIRAKSND